MPTEPSHEDLLREVLEQVTSNNRQMKPGSPMAELKAAIEAAMTSLPPLEFEEFKQAIDNASAPEELVRRAPEIIGWNADKIVEWVEQLAGKISAQSAQDGGKPV